MDERKKSKGSLERREYQIDTSVMYQVWSTTADLVATPRRHSLSQDGTVTTRQASSSLHTHNQSTLIQGDVGSASSIGYAYSQPSKRDCPL
jgi:hypothetical protein